MATLTQPQGIVSTVQDTQNGKHSSVQEIIHELTNNVMPVIDKVHHKFGDYEEQVAELFKYFLQLKNDAIEKGKNSKLKHKADDLAENLLCKIEKQVDFLNDYYLSNNKQDDRIINVVENRSSFQRVQHLIITVNICLGIALHKQWESVKVSPTGKKIQKQLIQLKKHTKVREVLIFADIAREFLVDRVYNRLYTPAITFAGSQYNSIINQTQITFNNAKRQLVKEYLPLVTSQYASLKHSSISFYQNKITIQFAQEYYYSNQQLIQNEMKEFQSSFMKYQDTITHKYKGIYTSALDEYKQRRQKKMLTLKEKNDQLYEDKNESKETIEEIKSETKSELLEVK